MGTGGANVPFPTSYSGSGESLHRNGLDDLNARYDHIRDRAISHEELESAELEELEDSVNKIAAAEHSVDVDTPHDVNLRDSRADEDIVIADDLAEDVADEEDDEAHAGESTNGRREHHQDAAGSARDTNENPDEDPDRDKTDASGSVPRFGSET